MKINQIIKERRKALNLTQEQIADTLGISVPAVSKWETGTSYPDITLLPILARILKTDLNTLLSFKEDLSKEEVGVIVNELANIASKEGFVRAFEFAGQQINEYPTCYLLLLNVAICLDGCLVMKAVHCENLDVYKERIERLYEKATASEENEIRNQARVMLFSKYMARQEYDRGEAILKQLPDQKSFDKRQLQANLYMAQGKYEEACELIEQKLLSTTNEVHAALMTLLDIALKEDRVEDASYIAQTSKKMVEVFDLWEYSSYVGHFQLYSARKNKVKCMKVLLPMLKALKKTWAINESPLYRHIKCKKNSDQQEMGINFRNIMISALKSDKEYEFLKDDLKFDEL